MHHRDGESCSPLPSLPHLGRRIHPRCRLAAAEQAHRAREEAEKSVELQQQRAASSKFRAASAVGGSSSMAVGGSRSGGSAGDPRSTAGPSSLFILGETNRIRRFTKFLIECGAKKKRAISIDSRLPALAKQLLNIPKLDCHTRNRSASLRLPSSSFPWSHACRRRHHKIQSACQQVCNSQLADLASEFEHLLQTPITVPISNSKFDIFVVFSMLYCCSLHWAHWLHSLHSLRRQ